MQIIVLGMHRSGTSLVTRLINMMGAYFAAEGASIGFNEENPKGFWERRDVIEANDAILALQQCRWDEAANWTPQPPSLPPELEKRLKNIVLEMDAHRPWVMKDPRLCLTLGSWKPFLEVPLAVIMYRDPLEIAKSLQTRNGMALHEGLALWEYYTVGMLNASAEMKRLFIRHDEFMADPVKATQALHMQLTQIGAQNLRLPSEQEIIAFVEPKYYRSRIEPLHEQYLTPAQLALTHFPPPENAPQTFSCSAGAQQILLSYARRRRAQEEIEQQRAAFAGQISALEQSLAEKETAWQAEKALLSAQYQTLQQALSDESLNYQRATDEIAALKNSLSWKLGHGVINTLRKVSGK